MQARTTDAQSAATFPVRGATVLPLAAAEDTSGAWEAFVLDLAPGASSPLHTLAADKVFSVLDGVVELVVGQEAVAAASGTTAHVPAGTPHRYENASGAPARLLVITTGGQQLAFLRGMSRLAADGPPAPEAVAEHAAEHGVRLLPPTGP